MFAAQSFGPNCIPFQSRSLDQSAQRYDLKFRTELYNATTEKPHIVTTQTFSPNCTVTLQKLCLETAVVKAEYHCNAKPAYYCRPQSESLPTHLRCGLKAAGDSSSRYLYYLLERARAALISRSLVSEVIVTGP
jgi:hypothetical protein